ncbi:hypothetical protein BBJ28_00003821 [Nothophytophthora sp. Chile5]|nr:hypothetical protein BBJ28_00003821 [Nothophytophthora sp. Chile5]
MDVTLDESVATTDDAAKRLAMLETGVDAFANDVVFERLRRVVQFVAGECRSRDEDAMFIVNEADCVARVMAGQLEAICAVLTVLRRLSAKYLSTNESSERESDVLNLRCEQEELIQQSLQQSPPVSNPPKTAEKLKRTPEVVGISSLRQYSPTPASSTIPSNLTVKKAPEPQQLPSKASTLSKKRRPLTGPKRSQSSVGKALVIADKSSLDQRGAFHDAEGLHVFGMLDPSAKKKSKAFKPERDCVGGEDALATRFCNWAQATLQVALPLDQIFVKRADHWVLGPRPKVQQAFSNGVLLCRIAAAIFEQYGDRLNRGDSDFTRLRLESFSSATNPQTSAHRRRNLELALAVFKACGVAEEALKCVENLRHLGNQSSPTTIWRVLDAVRHRVELLNQAKVSSQTSPQPETKDVSDSAVATDPSQLQSDSSRTNAASSPKNPPQGRRKQLVTAEFESAGVTPLKRSRPYITSEQMHAVTAWLTTVGFDVHEVRGATKLPVVWSLAYSCVSYCVIYCFVKAASCGVLQDPMRNGVLLW